MRDIQLKLNKMNLLKDDCKARLDVFISLENDPIMFQCGDLICSEHLNERDVKENEQKCNECQHEFKLKRLYSL